MPVITLPDGSQRRYDAPVTVAQVAADIGPGLAKAAVAGRVDGGRLVDTSFRVEADTPLAIVTGRDAEGLEVIRHSTAHLLAQAVKQLHPDAQVTIGPVIEDGFYYDFAYERPFTPEDLQAIEARMAELAEADLPVEREVMDRDDAVAFFRGIGEEYKARIIEDIPAGESISLYGQGDFKDLCRGPHVPSSGHLKAFKLTKVAGAYWRGDSRNEQLQRIYGTAWPTRDALKAYLQMLQEAARRDHRKLGADLDLFSFPEEIGSGLAVFHPKGGIIRRELENYSRARHEAAGYEFVNTPHITKAQLFETSGHLPYYADTMFPPMEVRDGDAAGQQYYLKAMNCPMHNLIFRSRGRSYRELPLRLFEFGTVYRHEKSGVVHGLTRVRGLTMDDSHIYCTREQMPGELRSLLTFVLDLLRDYGLDDFYLELSTRDDSGKFIGEPREWEEATETLRQAAEDSGLELVPDPGGAAFYGPKISVQARDAIGRTWQMSTIQLDFNQPKRFGLEYQAADGSRQQPMMIHRALFGSIERFFGVLTEHYAGAFPAWLAPVQVVGIPVREDHVPYVEAFAERLRADGIRAEVDASDDRMQKKIRTAQQQKIPFMVIAGDQDAADGTVSFRYRDGSQRNGVPQDEAVAHVVDVVRSRTNAGPTATAG
jgi:threonyl-tRNA synthetase